MRLAVPLALGGIFAFLASRAPVSDSDLFWHLALGREIASGGLPRVDTFSWTIVGRPYRIDNTLLNPSPTDYPCLGTLVGWLAQRDGYSGAVPPYVIFHDSTLAEIRAKFGPSEVDVIDREERRRCAVRPAHQRDAAPVHE